MLGGGIVTEPLDLDVVMDQPSFARARAIGRSTADSPRAAATVVRPRANRGRPKTGEGGRIAVRVPSDFRDDPGEFLKLLRGVQIDQSFPEECASVRAGDEG